MRRLIAIAAPKNVSQTCHAIAISVSRDIGDEHPHFAGLDTRHERQAVGIAACGHDPWVDDVDVRSPKSTSASSAASTFLTQSVLPCAQRDRQHAAFAERSDDRLIGLAGLAAAVPDLGNPGITRATA